MFRTSEGLKKKGIVGILAAASLVTFSAGLASCNLGRVNPAGERQEDRENYENQPSQSDDDENEGNDTRNRQEDTEDEDDD